MIISSIKQQQRNPERISVFIDGKYSFSLSLGQLVEHKLKHNLVLSDSDLKKFKKISDDGKLRARSLEWLTLRPHSIKEFKNYLTRKKVDTEQASYLIDEFLRLGYLNDQKFAEWFSEQRLQKSQSIRAIKGELFSKGITNEVIKNLDLLNNHQEDQSLIALVHKLRTKSRYQDQTKLKRYLAAKGFDYSSIKAVLADDATGKVD